MRTLLLLLVTASCSYGAGGLVSVPISAPPSTGGAVTTNYDSITVTNAISLGNATKILTIPGVSGIEVYDSAPNGSVYLSMFAETGNANKKRWSHYIDPSGNYSIQDVNDAFSSGIDMLKLQKIDNGGGISLGEYADGSGLGVAIGQYASGSANGVSIGLNSSGYNYGVAVGVGASGSNDGVAVGNGASGNEGVAVGDGSSGYNSGVAIGRDSVGYNYGVAIGRNASATGAGSVAIGGDDYGTYATVPNGWIDTVQLGRGTATLEGGLNFRGVGLVNNNGFFVGPIASQAPEAFTAAESGWTNTFGRNAFLAVDGTGVTYVLYNGVGTSVYTNPAVLAHDFVPVQSDGKVIITAGTAVKLRAIGF